MIVIYNNIFGKFLKISDLLKNLVGNL